MNRCSVVFFACVFATAANAHAFLLQSQPGADAMLKSAPKELLLNFSEPLEPGFSGIELSDSKGRSVELVPITVGGGSMRAAVGTLPPGRYHVKWHAVSKDSHRTDGQFTFTVQP